MLAVGEHLWGRVDEPLMRIASAFAGGVGCSHQELCGALSGGLMLIGLLYGRTSPEHDDTEVNARACAFRERFLGEFGLTRCADLRASGYGSEGRWPCSALVERAARVLLESLEQPV